MNETLQEKALRETEACVLWFRERAKAKRFQQLTPRDYHNMVDGVVGECTWYHRAGRVHSSNYTSWNHVLNVD